MAEAAASHNATATEMAPARAGEASTAGGKTVASTAGGKTVASTAGGKTSEKPPPPERTDNTQPENTQTDEAGAHWGPILARLSTRSMLLKR